MKRKYIIIVVFIALISKVSAQQTGNFTDNITFMGQQRTLACHVPSNYDSTVSYNLMIGLHGLGDNAVNYRNALINTLSWPSIFANTVFIFPDGGDDQNKDFYMPAGDEAVIQEAINYAIQNYNIDTNNIILQGFSLGGRSALKYGLDNHGTFKGLLLNTPAIQGLADAVNDPNGSLMFDYSNAPQIPIYVTIGVNDQIYIYNWMPVNERLKKNNAKVKTLEIAGMGHSVPSQQYISPAITFFADPASSDYDIDLFEIETDQRTCNPDIQPKCYIRNKGAQPVTSVDIDYAIGSSSGTYTWTGNIGMYEHAVVNLPLMTAGSGEQDLDLSIGDINGSFTDTINTDNDLSYMIYVGDNPVGIPYAEGFEANMEGWTYEETGSIFQWYVDGDVKKDGMYSIATFNTILMFYTLGYIESFYSPVMDLSGVASPDLTFDLAYNYHKYTPPYFTNEVLFADTLVISVSTDCGQTFQEIYRKGGADLATAPDPIINPLSLQQVFFTPDSGEWRNEAVDLSAFAGQTEVMLKFG
ncbi:MAG: alpha/beta hydrolase-fold protein, partial [Bacteroidota bacterium]